MQTVFQKLNLKQHRQILILNAPTSFEPELATLDGVEVLTHLQAVETIDFALGFVTGQAAVDALVPTLVSKAPGDPILWFAYPKGTSRKLKSEISRDRGWQALRDAGFDTVRAVAIDADWSALRFRRVEFIRA